MTSLSPGQIEAEKSIEEMLRRNGLETSEREIIVQKEPCIHFKVRGYEIWLYAEGASLVGPGWDGMYEKPDFKSVTELFMKVRDDLEGILTKRIDVDKIAAERARKNRFWIVGFSILICIAIFLILANRA